MRSELQKRTGTVQFNVTKADEENKKAIEGYFVVFNQRTELWKGCYEEIMPDAFNETLGNDIRALWNHNTQYVLGRNKSSTLELKIDGNGLFGRIELPDTSYARDLYELVKRGDVSQCSFGFNIVDEEWEVLNDGSELYRIKKVDLHEVSIVTFPAYGGTSAVAREKQKRASLERKKQKLMKRIKEARK